MRAAAETFHPGEFIREELEARGWTQFDLAEITGFSPQYINDLIAGRRDVGPRVAIYLSAAFGTSPELWMGLAVAHQLSLWARRGPIAAEVESIKQRAAARSHGAAEREGGE